MILICERGRDRQLRESCDRRAGLSRLRGRNRTGAILAAARAAADRESLSFSGAVAWMRGLSDTAGMRRGRRRRQRERKKISGKREQQQKSSGQTLHVSWVRQKPQGGLSIEQKLWSVQPAWGSPMSGRCKNIWERVSIFWPRRRDASWYVAAREILHAVWRSFRLHRWCSAVVRSLERLRPSQDDIVFCGHCFDGHLFVAIFSWRSFRRRRWLCVANAPQADECVRPLHFTISSLDLRRCSSSGRTLGPIRGRYGLRTRRILPR
jgi:hypothetical protein